MLYYIHVYILFCIGLACLYSSFYNLFIVTKPKISVDLILAVSKSHVNTLLSVEHSNL